MVPPRQVTDGIVFLGYKGLWKGSVFADVRGILVCLRHCHNILVSQFLTQSRLTLPMEAELGNVVTKHDCYIAYSIFMGCVLTNATCGTQRGQLWTLSLTVLTMWFSALGQKEITGGWSYAPTGHWSFHILKTVQNVLLGACCQIVGGLISPRFHSVSSSLGLQGDVV